MPSDEFQDRIGRIEELVRQIESISDPNIRASALELVQSVMELHGAGLDRMMEIANEAGETGDAIIGSFAEDNLVSSLLLLHNLHPDDLETRVRRALDQVRPYLNSHGGNLEFIGIDDGRVRIRLQGSCQGCPGAAVTSRTTIEKSIFDHAPDVVAVEIEGVDRNSSHAPGLVELGTGTSLVSITPKESMPGRK